AAPEGWPGDRPPRRGSRPAAPPGASPRSPTPPIRRRRAPALPRPLLQERLRLFLRLPVLDRELGGGRVLHERLEQGARFGSPGLLVVPDRVGEIEPVDEVL